MGDAENFIPEQFDENFLGDGKPFQMPSRDELLEMLESMDLPDEEKEAIRKNLLDAPATAAAGIIPQFFDSQTIVFLIFAFIFFAVILFFGYKLYKSIKDKELKREEKRKAKMMKNKKK